MSPLTPAPQFPDRRAHLLLATAVMLFALYASLLPFQFRLRDPVQAWRSFVDLLTAAGTERISRSNYLANVLLFVPIGYGLLGAWRLDREDRRGLLAGVLVLLPVSLAVSVTAEYLQMFAPRRVPSRADIVAQSLGCLAGFAAWAIVGRPVTAWIRASASRQRGDRFTRLLMVYAAGWGLLNLAPFDVTIDAGDLARRVHRGLINVVPFAAAGRSITTLAWDGFVTTLAAVPLGVLATVGWTDGRRRSAGPAVARAAGAIVVMEVAQIFLASHAADITDALLGTLGAAIGVMLARRSLSDDPAAGTAGVVRARDRWRLPAAALWVAVLALYHWMPFAFSADGAAVRHKLSRISLIPFASYARGSDLNALDTLLTKLALAVPLGLLVAAPRHARGWPATALRLAFAVAVFATLEFGQLFVRTRVPDPTDVLVGVAGFTAGLAAADWLQRGRPPRPPG